MATIKDSFQKEIKYKLSQKATSNIREETILLKAFKYFDLNNTQCVDKEAFIKVIEKIGIIIFNKEDFYELFYYYSEGQEQLNYYQFNQSLFGFKAGNTRKFLQQEKQSQKQQDSGIDDLFNKFQIELCQRGPSGILSIGIVFRNMDIYNASQHIIDFQDISQCFQELKFSSLTEQELQLFFSYFDDRKIGLLNYDQFLQKLLSKLQQFSARRHQVIQKIFSSILIKEKSAQEIISLEKLVNYFYAQNHPDVKRNIIKSELIQSDFQQTLNDYYVLRGQGDGCISMEEFEEYYKFTTFYIFSDDDFENILENVWNQPSQQQSQQLQQPQQIPLQEQFQPQQQQQAELQSLQSAVPYEEQQSQPSIQKSLYQPQSQQNQYQQKFQSQSKHQAFYSRASFDKIRTKLLQKGVKGLLGIQYSFKLGDYDKDSKLTYKEFNDILQLFNIFMEEEEKQAIFSELDPEKTGILKIEQLVQEIRGEMNNFRRSIILKIFKELDRSQQGYLQLSDIKTLYNPVNHPQVLNGQKTQNDIVNEFIETFEQHHQLFNSKKSTTVALQQFIDYYQNLSATIPNDQYFELIALNSFKIFYKPLSQQSQQPEQIIAAGQRTHFDLPNQFGATPNKLSKTIMNAPFGTSNIQTDYSTYLRPQSSHQQQQYQQQLQQSQFQGKTAAGAPSWPGLNQLYTPQEISYLQAQGEIQAYQPSQQQPQEQLTTLQGLFVQVKQKLTARGFKAGILNFLRQIQRSTNPQTNTLTFDQFISILQNLRLNDFSEMMIQQLIGEMISVDKIMEFVSCELNQRQRDAVEFVFNKLDKSRNGTITLDDVRFNFNPRGHPDVPTGKKTEDEILGDFLDTFEQYHAIFWNDPKLRNQTVTIEEFVNYYANLASTVADEEKFIQMVVQTWELE